MAISQELLVVILLELTEDEQENLATNMETAVEEDAALTQSREKFEKVLSLIKCTAPVPVSAMVPKEEPLYKMCMYALVLLKKVPASMSVQEQLYWSHSAVLTVGKKIKEISEYPHLVLYIATIQKSLISHTEAVLKNKITIETDVCNQ